MRAADGKTFSNISATTATFYLDGGKYGVDMVASGTGSVKLQRIAADGTTAVSVSSATDFTTTSGYATVDLPPGNYQFTVATFTAIYARVSRIPGE